MPQEGFSFVVSSEQIIYVITFCGVVWGAIYGFIKFVNGIKKPNEELKLTVENHTELLAKDNERLKAVEKSNRDLLIHMQNDVYSRLNKHDEMIAEQQKSIKEVETTNKMILRSLVVIMNHEATGNGQAKLKEAMDELNKYLIEK